MRRYFSAFLSHATGENLKTIFEKTVGTHPLPKHLQISMDDLCVNMKFYDQSSEHYNDTYNAKLIDIGSCALEVAHGAFQT